MTLQYVVDGYRTRLARANVDEPLLGKIDVLEIVQVFENRFPRIERLGAPSCLRQGLEATFDFGWQADDETRRRSSVISMNAVNRRSTRLADHRGPCDAQCRASLTHTNGLRPNVEAWW